MSLSTRKAYLGVSAFLIITMSTLSHAKPDQSDRPKGPPPEAIEACASLSEGDACTFTGRRDDTLEGSCIVPKKDPETLACKPSHSKHSHKEKS